MLVPTPEVERIIIKPGREWTEDERIVEWLNTSPQREVMVIFCHRHLGQAAQLEDAEDVWGDFNVTQLNSVIDRYDPKKGSFIGYLLVSLQRFCWRRGDKIRKRAGVEIHLQPVTSNSGIQLEFEAASDIDIEEQAGQKELLRILVDCFNSLPEKHRDVLYRRIWQEKSYKEIAEELGITEGHARIIQLRGLGKLAVCLKNRLGRDWNYENE
ncbi:MAG: sigma-70 family RNA polymerase sigma factor [Acidobacteriota bacterium]